MIERDYRNKKKIVPCLRLNFSVFLDTCLSDRRRAQKVFKGFHMLSKPVHENSVDTDDEE